jgi:stalled ribosome rescue protein Dom34
MALDVGLWIDHKKAVIVRLNDHGQQIQEVDSGITKHTRYRGIQRSKTPYTPQYQQGDDQLDRQFTQRVNKFYEQVIAQLRGADAVLILGPGEAKAEFGKRLAQSRIGVKVAAVETVGKMTVRQLAAKVRNYFHPRNTARGS